ncbi:MAG: DUF4381 domain-containing protein [Pseudomonadota bacterium]
MDKELQQLKDIHLPQHINMLPTAPGWIILYVILLVLTSYLIYVWYKHIKRKATVKFALAKLNKLKDSSVATPENIHIAVEISALLRRTALYYFRREEIAGLSGNAWLEFLNRSGNTTQFTEATGRLLIDAPYRKHNTHDLSPLFALTQAWLLTISKKPNLSTEK